MADNDINMNAQQDADATSTEEHGQGIAGSAPQHSPATNPETHNSASPTMDLTQTAHAHPFTCPVDAGCTYTPQGLSRQNALAIHMLQVHSVEAQAAETETPRIVELLTALAAEKTRVKGLTAKLEWEQAIKAEMDLDLDVEKEEARVMTEELIRLRMLRVEEREVRAAAVSQARQEGYAEGYEAGYRQGLNRGD